MACIDTNHKRSDVCFVDSGFSNNMKSTKSLFQELNKRQNNKVQVFNSKEMQGEGKDTVCIESSHDIVKMLDVIQFVPNLGYNMFSLVQPMFNRHSLSFDEDGFVITNKNKRKKVRTTMMSNKIFLLDVSDMASFTLVASTNDDSKLQHLRYGHLNIKGLKFLVEKGMVLGLPKIDYIGLCEGCIYGKQTWKSLPFGKVWRS